MLEVWGRDGAAHASLRQKTTKLACVEWTRAAPPRFARFFSPRVAAVSEKMSVFGGPRFQSKATGSVWRRTEKCVVESVAFSSRNTCSIERDKFKPERPKGQADRLADRQETDRRKKTRTAKKKAKRLVTF